MCVFRIAIILSVLPIILLSSVPTCLDYDPDTIAMYISGTSVQDCMSDWIKVIKQKKTRFYLCIYNYKNLIWLDLKNKFICAKICA